MNEAIVPKSETLINQIGLLLIVGSDQECMDRQQRVLLKDRVLLIKKVHGFACLSASGQYFGYLSSSNLVNS